MRFTVLLRRHPKTIVALFLLWLTLAISAIPQLELEYDFESFFPLHDPDLEFYLTFRERFEPDDNFLLIAFPSTNGIHHLPFLQQIDALIDSFQQVPHVEEVAGLTRLRYPLKTPFGWVDVPAVHLDDSSRLSEDLQKASIDPRIRSIFMDTLGQSLNLWIRTQHPLKQTQDAYMLDSIRAIIDRSGLQSHMAGKAYLQTSFVRKNLREMQFYTLLSGAVVFLILWMMFRKPLTVAVAFLSVIVSLGLFLGTLALIGVKLNFMAQLFPILMLIVGLSDVIHLITRYSEEIQDGRSSDEAWRITFHEIGRAVLLTSVTTAIGFLALMTSDIMPIRQFGWKAALGVMIAYVVAIVFLPAVLSFFAPHRLVSNRSSVFHLEKWMWRLYHFTLHHPKGILFGALVFLTFATMGVSQISMEARLRNDLPAKERVMADYHFFESRYGGFRPFEMAIDVKPPAKWSDFEVIQAIDDFSVFLSDSGEIQALRHPALFFRSLNAANHGNRIDHWRLPDADQWETVNRQISQIPERYQRQLVDETGQSLRITGKTKDLGSDTFALRYAQWDHWLYQHWDTSRLQWRFTGTGLLFDQNNQYLIRNLFTGLGLAFAIISLLMMALFRDLRMVLISLLPNIIPLFLMGGLLGWVGLPLDAPTSIIFAIAFGIAVDDTIHLLSRYRLERLKGASREESIHRMLKYSGKAVILTTFVLLAGFMLLATSDFTGTYRVGLLISFTLAVALIADLFLLPVFLRWLPDKTR